MLLPANCTITGSGFGHSGKPVNGQNQHEMQVSLSSECQNLTKNNKLLRELKIHSSPYDEMEESASFTFVHLLRPLEAA